MPITRRRLRASSLAPLVAVLLTLLLSTPAQAQAPAKEDRPAPAADTTPLPDSITGGDVAEAGPSGTSATGAIAKLVVGLAVVLAVIYGLYWLLKSVGRSRRKGATADGSMAVVGTTVLSPGRSLHLVRVGDDLLLVGSAEQAVTRVHAWTGDEARRLDGLLATPIDGLADTGAGARLLDELRRRTVRG